MQKIGLSFTILLIAALAGCGGGGGGSATSSPSLMEISEDILGTWQVENIDLPNDEIAIEQDGKVVIEVADSQTRDSSTTNTVCIGNCSSAGILQLNGNWTNGGIEHSIQATGSIDTDSNKLTLLATVTTADETVCQNAQITGTKCSETSDETDDQDDPDLPPAPPLIDTEEDIDAPPAPPF